LYGTYLDGLRHKILWFKEGITDKSFNAVKMNLIATPERYETFQAIQEAYCNFHCQRCASDPLQVRQVASVHNARRGSKSGQSFHGNGDQCSCGVLSKAELDACHIVDREYSIEEYKKSTALQKQKLWLLQNGDKQPGTGPECQSHPCSVATASSTNSSSKKRKRSNDQSDMSDIEDVDDSASHGSSGKWGRNRDNPAVAGHQPKPEKK
jgi:hypothetical protein